MRRDRGPQPLLQRVERARRVVSHCSQAAIRAYDEEALLAEACRHLVDQGDFGMAWFAEAQVGKDGLRSLAHAGSDRSGVRADQLPNDVSTGPRSPTMRALHEQRPQVVRGIPGNPTLEQRHPEAKALGYAAICAFPLQFGPHGAGVLTILAPEPDAFAPEEVALLRELAGDMAVAISVLRARKANDALAERLEAAERRFRSVVEFAPIGVLQVRADGRVTLANHALASLLGYTTADEVQALDMEGFASHLRPSDLERLRQVVAGGPPYAPFKAQLRRLDGAKVWAEVHAKPANGGSMEGTVEAFLRDLTAELSASEARRAQEDQRREVIRLQELDRMRAEFMGRASHELNTPLTPILLQVQALQAVGTDPRQARGLKLIERNVLRLAGLVKDLLAASTLESRQLTLEPVAIDVSVKAAAVVDAFRDQAEEKGIALRLEAPGKVPAFADRGRVFQVLFNLVGNALKFTPRGGTVVLRCEQRPDGMAQCSVTDSGRGFHADAASRLFMPFGRLHEHLTDDPGGTGLGLFISKATVEQSGGTLWATSSGPGQGAVFGFTLPAQAPQGGPALPAPSPGRGIRSATGFAGSDAGAVDAPDPVEQEQEQKQEHEQELPPTRPVPEAA